MIFTQQRVCQQCLRMLHSSRLLGCIHAPNRRLEFSFSVLWEGIWRGSWCFKMMWHQDAGHYFIGNATPSRFEKGWKFTFWEKLVVPILRKKWKPAEMGTCYTNKFEFKCEDNSDGETTVVPLASSAKAVLPEFYELASLVGAVVIEAQPGT